MIYVLCGSMFTLFMIYSIDFKNEICFEKATHFQGIFIPQGFVE